MPGGLPIACFFVFVRPGGGPGARLRFGFSRFLYSRLRFPLFQIVCPSGPLIGVVVGSPRGVPGPGADFDVRFFLFLASVSVAFSCDFHLF